MEKGIDTTQGRERSPRLPTMGANTVCGIFVTGRARLAPRFAAEIFAAEITPCVPPGRGRKTAHGRQGVDNGECASVRRLEGRTACGSRGQFDSTTEMRRGLIHRWRPMEEVTVMASYGRLDGCEKTRTSER